MANPAARAAGRERAWWKPACRSCSSTRSAARTSWSSTAPASCSTPIASWPRCCRVFEEALVVTEWTRAGRSPGLRPAGAAARGRPDRGRVPLPGAWDCVITSARTAFPAFSSACPAVSTAPFRRHRRRRAGCGSCARRICCPAPIPATHSLEDAAECARLLGIRSTPSRSRRAMDAFAQALAPLFAGLAGRHYRGEHPVARARAAPDGALATSSATWC